MMAERSSQKDNHKRDHYEFASHNAASEDSLVNHPNVVTTTTTTDKTNTPSSAESSAHNTQPPLTIQHAKKDVNHSTEDNGDKKTATCAFTLMRTSQDGKCQICKKSTIGLNGKRAPPPKICDSCWRNGGRELQATMRKRTKKPPSSTGQLTLAMCGFPVIQRQRNLRKK